MHLSQHQVRFISQIIVEKPKNVFMFLQVKIQVQYQEKEKLRLQQKMVIKK